MLNHSVTESEKILSRASKFTTINSTDAPNFDKIQASALRKSINISNLVIISKLTKQGLIKYSNTMR
jgi:hypothetical protein